MRICLLGKHPPIQGGVSMRTYRYAHLLAEEGHDVQVFTTADEAKPPFRMYMREADWERCNAEYENGRVQVHWTEPADASQSYIPMATPYVSKLTSLALAAAEKENFDLIFSFYMEPFGVAGHLIASLLGIPHIIKTAGSDAGRLWKHQQLKPLYDRIFQSADALIVGGVVATKMKEIGIPKSRLFPERDIFKLSKVFTATGPTLDIEPLLAESANKPMFADLVWGQYRPDLKYLGLYGKLGSVKGSFSLLKALKILVNDGLDVGLLMMAHGWSKIESDFRHVATELGLENRICQIPFLPSWRVPEFSRRCVAICCLEQDFPITFHQPIIPREVLMSGTCLVGSTEVIKKLPSSQRVVHGYNCIAVKDVNDIEELSSKLHPLVTYSSTHSIIGIRGRAYGLDLEHQNDQKTVIVERIIPRIFGGRVSGPGPKGNVRTSSLSEFAIAALPEEIRNKCLDNNPNFHDPNFLNSVMSRLDDYSDSSERISQCREAIELDLALLESVDRYASKDELKKSETALDSIFRLPDYMDFTDPWSSEKIAPYFLSHIITRKFSCDVNEILRASSTGLFPESLEQKESWAIILWNIQKSKPVILVSDRRSIAVLELCNGTHTVSQISDKVEKSLSKEFVQQVIQRYFELGALGFCKVSKQMKFRQQPNMRTLASMSAS